MFHYRHYRYVRMMLRKYPKMRQESLAWSSGPGVDGICQNSVSERLTSARKKWDLKAGLKP
jgi:hypothetical protein